MSEATKTAIKRGVGMSTSMGACMTQNLGVDVPLDDEEVNEMLKDACMAKFVTSKMRQGGKYRRRRRKSRRSRKSKRKSRRKKRRKSKKRKTRRRRRRRK